MRKEFEFGSRHLRHHGVCRRPWPSGNPLQSFRNICSCVSHRPWGFAVIHSLSVGDSVEDPNGRGESESCGTRRFEGGEAKRALAPRDGALACRRVWLWRSLVSMRGKVCDLLQKLQPHRAPPRFCQAEQSLMPDFSPREKKVGGV